MKFIKSFESYEPTTKPAEPKTVPTTRPSRPSPIRRDRPSVEPAPKAKKKLSTATAEDVVQRYMDERGVSEGTNNSGPMPGLMGFGSDPKMPLGSTDRHKRELINMFGDSDWFESIKVEGQRDDKKYIIVANRILTNDEMEQIPTEIGGCDVVIDNKIK